MSGLHSVDEDNTVDTTTVNPHVLSTPRNVDSKSSTGLITPPHSSMEAAKRKLDELNDNFDESFTEDAILDRKQLITSAAITRVLKPVNIVDKLMKSIYSHDHCADTHALETGEISIIDLTDDNLNFIEREHLKKVFVLDYNIGEFQRQRSRLSRRTALSMMEIAKISEEYEASQHDSLTKQMIPVYKTYATQNGFVDVKKYARKKSKTLYQFIRRGKMVLRMVEILNGEHTLDLYIPYNFHWARFYSLVDEDLDRFCDMLREHVNKRMKEYEFALIVKDTQLSNRAMDDVIISESKCLDESSFKGPITQKECSFDSSDKIHTDSYSVLEDADFDINQNENSTNTVVEDAETEKDLRIIISGKYSIVSREALESLEKKDGWLYCDIINSYLDYIVTNVTDTAANKILIIQTYASQKIESHSKISINLEDIKKYIERSLRNSDDFVSFNWAVGIFNVGNHWVTLVVDFNNNTVYEMDSLCQTKKDYGCGRELTFKFSIVLNDIYKKQFAIKVKDVYQQENGYDCGILALMNAENFVKIISNGKDFDQENISCGNAAAYRELMIQFYNEQKEVQKVDDKK